MKDVAERAKNWLLNNNFPCTDNILLENSTSAFSNGAKFGIEIPVINSPDVLIKTVELLNKHDAYCDRFNETKGTFLLTNSEIKEMLAVCKDNSIGMFFSLSARPEYDVKASFCRSKFGLEQCRKLNNNDSIKYSLEEAIRLSELGCRGIIVYDLGVLYLLNKMREDKLLPQEMIFKASSHCMATNPFIAKILEDNGANSITTMHDTSLVMLQAMRKMSPNLLLDVPIDVYPDKGGYIRFNEIANIVQVASPVMLKLGASAQTNPYSELNDTIIKTRVKRVVAGIEHVEDVLGKTIRVDKHETLKAVPV